MHSLRLLLVALIAALPAAGQYAKFECQAVGSTFPPLAGVPDCEGLVAEPGLPDGEAFVLAADWCGMPTQGARYARLQAGPYVTRPAGAPVPRPLPIGTTELRIPIPLGATMVAFDWTWYREEISTTYNDGFDFSVCDASGARVMQCAWGEVFTYPQGCNGPVHFVAPLPIAAAAAPLYLSCAVYDGFDFCCGDNYLAIDDVQFAIEHIRYECQQPGGPFPYFGTPPDCEGVTGSVNPLLPIVQGFVGVDAAPLCSMPTQGLQYARITAETMDNIPAGGLVLRPLAATVSEMRIPIPYLPKNTIAFDWQWYQLEGHLSYFNDGFDVSICDPAGNRLAVCVFGDASVYFNGCNPMQRFFGVFFGLPPGAYLSFAAFNGGDTAVDSSLLIDAVSFADRPRMLWRSPPGAAGGLELLIDDGKPNDVYLAPIVLAPGAYPNGWFYGVDIALTDLLLEINLGPPFIGLLDPRGQFAYGPLFGLSGLQVWGVAMDDLTAPWGPRAGYPVHYTVP